MDQEKEDFPITALHEIKILQGLQHDNIVRLIKMCRLPVENLSRSKFYFTFKFCDRNLAGILRNVQVKFSLGHIKSIMQQLLNALYFIHTNYIIHRDIKPANILITRNDVHKLADFVMQGETEQHQLQLIASLCGSIEPSVWPDVDLLPLYNKMKLLEGERRKVYDRLKPYIQEPLALNLIDRLLILDPKQRIDADNAFDSDFFYSDPPVADLKELLSKYHSMFDLKQTSRNLNHQKSKFLNLPCEPIY
ncbi:unnamed protein product [Rotaria sp. Silwood2]|nr:unnamed protein product [Rotaria sp. Silwood2]CAF4556267.1 unnamed protein product [Rotaria sp. Silwood2]